MIDMLQQCDDDIARRKSMSSQRVHEVETQPESAGAPGGQPQDGGGANSPAGLYLVPEPGQPPAPNEEEQVRRIGDSNP